MENDEISHASAQIYALGKRLLRDNFTFAPKLQSMKYAAAILFALALWPACRNAPATSNIPAEAVDTQVAEQNQEPPADFLAFYEKFHADSLYQIAHITWPLQGVTTIDVDSIQKQHKEVFWELKDWQMHKPVDFSSGDFKRNWQLLGDVLVVEHISYAAANFGLERRFAKRGEGNWELIFYSDMQELK